MADITRLLRDHDDARLYREADVLMSAAADEIERLRGERKVLADLLAEALPWIPSSPGTVGDYAAGGLRGRINTALSNHQSTGTQS